MARNYGVSYNPLQTLKEGIGRVESGNNYQALGQEIKRKTGTDRAYGKYQVMGANIPSWTEQALGRRLTPFEFLHSPEAQEAVFENQMMNNLHKYGSLQDAASVWFSGRPLAQAQKAGAHDINMGVGQYVANALGPQAGPSAGVQVAGGDEELFRRLQARAAQRVTPGVQGEVTAGAPEAPEAMDAFRRLQERASQRIAPLPLPEAPQAVPHPAPPITITPQPSPVPQPEWGAGQEFLNAVTAGAVPSVRAALGPYTTGQIQQARKAYEQEYPYRSAAAEIAGGVAQGVGLAAAAPMAAGAVLGSKALQAIPYVQKALPFVERLAAYRPGMAGPFPSGGYVAKPGTMGAAERIIGGGVIGAGKGGTQAALNVGVHPEVPAGEQIATGMGVGAVAEPVARYMTGAAGPAMAPRIEEPVRDIGKLAQSKFNISLMPWQLSNMPAEQQLSSMLLTPEVAVKQAKQFSKAVGNLFGHIGESTPKAIAARRDEIGESVRTIAQGTPIDLVSTGLGRQTRREIDALVHKVIASALDPADKDKVLRTIQKVDSTVFQKGLTGDQIQDLVQKNGTINHGLPPTSNSIYQYYNTQLQHIADKVFDGATVPGKAEEWRKARGMYKIASMAEEAATLAGILDPKKFANAADQRQASGAARELQDIGNVMFSVDEKGKPIVSPLERKPRIWEHPAVQILGTAAPIMAGGQFELGREALSTIGFSPLTAAIGGAGLAALRYGGSRAYEDIKHRMLTSPYYSRAIMQGEAPVLQNVLAGPIAARGPVSAAETYKSRRKK